MDKKHAPSTEQSTALLTAIHDAEEAANALLEQARGRHDETLAKARSAATQWEQKELETARTETQHWLDAELKAIAREAEKHGSKGSADAEKTHAQGEKNLEAAVALVTDSFHRFVKELAEPSRNHETAPAPKARAPARSRKP